MNRDIEVSAISHQRAAVSKDNWTVLDLSTLPANSVTAFAAGADVAQLEVVNTGDKVVGIKLYNVAGNPAIDDNTLQLDAGSSIIFPRVNNLQYVAYRSVGDASSVAVTLYSHQNSTSAPWV